MRSQIPLLAVGFALVVMAVALPAKAYVRGIKGQVHWSGPGYYAAGVFGGLDAGPLSSEANCKTAISTHVEPKDRDLLECIYFSEDPTKGWSGPGYYAVTLYGSLHGPFSSETDCKAAISARAEPKDRAAFDCGYFPVDPAK